MADSSLVDAAVITTLASDSALLAILPDGVFFDEAPPACRRFAIVSLVDSSGIPTWDPGGGVVRAMDDRVYAVTAVVKGTTGDIAAAAARINALLHNQSLSVSGYTFTSTAWDEELGDIRYTEVDDLDASIRWQHRGAHYRVQASI